MQPSSWIASRPVIIFIILAIGELLLPSLVIPCWYNITKHMKENVELNANNFYSGLLSEIENTAKLLHPVNSSATNLARIISSSINGSELSASDVENKVAPFLFQAFSTIPLISQISYIGLEGLFFSYYHDGNQTFALYTNSTASSNLSISNVNKKYTWYKQPVDLDTGQPYGVAIESHPFITANDSWIKKALNSTHGYPSLGNGWNGAQDHLFLNTVGINGQGVISLGFLVNTLIDFFKGIDLYGGSVCLATQYGEMLVGGLTNTNMIVTGNSVSFYSVKPAGDQIGHVGRVSCMPNDGMQRASILNIGETEYMVSCSPLEIVGVQLVYVLAFPYDGVVSSVHRSSKITLILSIVMIAAIIISIFSFILLMIRAATREMHLCLTLIKQMEATQQAERKSINKSLAFASASHDIRTALAGITGLIGISYEEVPQGSELETNLRQMDACTNDLFGLLNSILDTSKIEAGKMQLEEEEFDLAHLLEDVVDLYHPVGMRKGIDVVLDPYDGSILKLSCVKGDRGKLKQVLCNLLSNAVKFTFEGHVSVRAWAQKPSLGNQIIASNQNNLWKHFSLCFYNNSEAYYDLETINAVKQNPNSMEYVFEVDDTGKGIPKEKHISVFENFFQVKETALGQGGTGLGLGIVQSLVRLMGGEIRIVDKENGKRGTCFRFNVFLTTSWTPYTDNTKCDIEMGGDSISDGTHQYLGLTIKTPTPGLFIRTPSPRLSILSSSPKIDGSHVVLLIRSEERRRTSHKFMEGLGIKVTVVKKWESFHSTLMRIKSKQNVSSHISSGKFDFGSRSGNSSPNLKDVPLSAMDGMDQKLTSNRSSPLRGAPSFVLLVIDASAGPFQELYRAVAEFKRGLHTLYCKVVWLDKQTSHSINFRSFDTDRIDSSDDIFLKPFHGSRLYHVIRLLPEFGGALPPGVSAKPKKESTDQTGKVSKDPGLSPAKHSHCSPNKKIQPSSPQQVDIKAEGSSTSEEYRKKSLSRDLDHSPLRSKSSHSPAERNPIRLSEIKEDYGNLNSEKPLSGMKFLVAEDTALLRKLAMAELMKLGATVKLCENGEEALELVRMGLQEQREYGDSIVLPYDYILMDCEMPKMNGYEATRHIRKEERCYGVHIPIIALTAHISGDEANKMTEAGMDFHLQKPLRRENLVEAIRYIKRK